MLKTVLAICFGIIVFPFLLYAKCDLGDMAIANNRSDKAVREYAKCGELFGDIDSLYKVASMYYKGEGTAPQYDKALSYFMRAANFGHAPSQKNLGLLYMRGEGTEKNYVRAYMWTYLAGEDFSKRWYYAINWSDADEQMVERGPDLSAKKNMAYLQKILSASKQENTIVSKALKEVNAWKNRRLHEFAKKVLSADDYETFSKELRRNANDSVKVSEIIANLRKKGISIGIIRNVE